MAKRGAKGGRRSWGVDLKRGGVKTNNHPAAHGAKVTIRENLLNEIGRDTARVFDAFAGDGAMFRDVWSKAGRGWVGCDQQVYWDGLLRYVADNRRVMRAIDLQPFNVFDFDSWGGPWEQCIILCDRRGRLAPGERLAVAITEGSALRLKLSGWPQALRSLAGFRLGTAGAATSLDEVLDRTIDGFARRLGAKVARRWQATGKGGAQVRYVGLIMEGVGAS